ncbi:integral membrane [Fusarium albosuccineum]|uniref:Integral membrane n=1 Tax=Fusarium albosuccineum TaxID=1237068 RepID=A0A8H4L5H3_9HYPO|nr:integral membrane [Fusarium albosuccineum]
MSGPPKPPSDGSPYFPISERAATLAVTHIAATSPLLAISLAMFVTRIWLRATPAWRISSEDYVMAIGVGFAIVDFGFLIPQMYTEPQLITETQRTWSRKYAFLAIPIWGIAMTFIKCSIAMMMYRIQPNVMWWRVFCFFIMGLLIAYGVGNTFFILLQCRPLEAAWNPAILTVVEGASCLPQSGIHIASNTGSGVNIATDIMLSLAPTLFLWKLRRPMREKMLVGILMGVGLFASVASIVKTTLVKEFGSAKDGWALTNAIATWTALEQLLAMIASSAPFLKPVVQSALHRVGWSLSDSAVTPSNYGNRYHGMGYGQGFRGTNQTRSRTGTNKGIAVSRRDLGEGDEDPFATTETVNAIPLESRVRATNRSHGEQNVATVQGTTGSRDSRSWCSNEDNKSEDREFTPTHAL